MTTERQTHHPDAPRRRISHRIRFHRLIASTLGMRMAAALAVSFFAFNVAAPSVAAETDAVIAPPFYLRLPGEDEQSQTEMITPLYYDSRGPESRFSLLAPVFARYRDAAGAWTLIPPLLSWFSRSGEDRTDVVLPLYANLTRGERGLNLLLPAWLHLHDAQRELTVAPLLLSAGYRDRVESWWWTALYYEESNNGGEAQLLFPLGIRHHDRKLGRDAGYFLTALWSRGARRGWTHVLPLYFSGYDGPTRWQLLLPVGFRYRSPGEAFTVLGTGFYLERKTDTVHGILPLYIYGSGLNQEYFYSPLACYTRSGERSSGFVGPYVFSQTDYRDFSALVPLWWSYRLGDERTDVLLPLYYSHSDSLRSITLTPLSWSRQTDDSLRALYGPLWLERGPDDHERTVLAPLYWHEADGDGGFSTAGLLYWDWWEAGSRTRMAIPLWVQLQRPGWDLDLWLLGYRYRNQHRQSERWGVAPLFEVAESETESRWEVLYGLLGARERDGERDWRVLWMWI